MPINAAVEYFDVPRYVYHWHGEGFQLPSEAQLLARGETFEAQAFRYGETAYGVQFHPEITKDTIDYWTTAGTHMLALPGAQSREQQMQKYSLYGGECETWLQGFLSHWIDTGKSYIPHSRTGTIGFSQLVIGNR